MDIISAFQIKPTNQGGNELKDKTFDFIVKLLGCRNQLRINHWQTTSYAEHKMLDDLIGAVDSNTDLIAEAALGLFERPQINTMSTNISDMRIASTKFVLDEMCEELCHLIEEYKVTQFEGMITLLGDFCADLNKFKYLSTLE